jgi:hypothetical protein
MSTTNFPGGVTSFGVPLYGMGGMPVPTRLGKVLFVHAGTGAGANDGLSADFPLATFDQAVNKCTNNAGDVIIGLPGHAESIVAAGGLDLDVIGVTVIGYGSGSNRPTITFTTATTADMDIDAANVTIVNLLFVAGIDALVAPIDVNAADFKMLNCETRDVAGSYQTVDFILTDDNCDRFVISGWKHTGDSAAGAETAISVIGGDDWVIEDFWIYGNFSVAAIENVTTAGNRVRIGGGAKPCFIWTENAADVAITMVATTTGMICGPIDIMLQDNAANITEALVGAAMSFFQPLRICNLAGEVGMDTKITASTDA